MKILLINNNPVVSRLTALSARKEDIEIDEIQEVTELSSDVYDIVFVDAESCSKDVRDVISENIKTKKRVLFYAEGDEEEKSSFDLSILKPFLPSEVSAVIRLVEESETETIDVVEENNFNILDEKEELKENDLFTLDGLDELEENKEKLNLTLDKSIDLEDEKLDFNAKLEEAFPLKINGLDDDLFEDELNVKKSEKTTKQEENDLFDLDLDDELFSKDTRADKTEEKKEEVSDSMKKFDLEDDVLEITNEKDKELALEVEKPVLEEVKKETQVLDELEIENIKGILTEDISDDMTLEDLMPAMTVMPLVEKEEEKEVLKEEGKESSKEQEAKTSNSLNIDSTILSQTLAAMPVENLRELLAGTKINIKIKFPKSKK